MVRLLKSIIVEMLHGISSVPFGHVVVSDFL